VLIKSETAPTRSQKDFRTWSTYFAQKCFVDRKQGMSRYAAVLIT